MKTIYTTIFYLLFSLVLLYIRTDNFRDFNYDKGDFNDVIIGNYNKEADEEGFQQVSFTKYSSDDRINKASTNKIDINNALFLFDDLYLVEDKKRLNLEDKKYTISFYNTNTYESIDIKVYDESHIYVWITLVDKNVDKKSKTITYDRDHIYHFYYIQEGVLNLEKLEEIFNSIDD